LAKPFNLVILTPEREFYNGTAESLTVESIDGQLSVLADHIPLVIALGVGTLRIKNGDEVLEAFHSEGFMEVRSDATIVLSQACEWPQEIDMRRAEEARARAESRLEQRKNAVSVERSKIALARALTRIKVKSHQQ
jgi:F-type H+-transporting ATPase subunit epsilon